jgi:peptidoglycan hydrolase FlgJ
VHLKIQPSALPIKQDPQEKAAKLDAQIRDASQMYETYFLGEMVKAMRSTVPRDGGIMKPGFAEKIFEQQLDQQYVDGWAKKGGIGLADMIHEQVSAKFNATANRGSFSLKKGMMPVSPKQVPHSIPATDSMQMKTIPRGESGGLEYRFEVPNPSGGTYEAQAPYSGRITDHKTLGEGWNLVKLDHGQGVSSELTFPGVLPEMVAGIDVKAGQKLGTLDPSRLVLAWKLDWT